MRASTLRTVQELSKEALEVHPRAKLSVLGRRLLVERIVEQGWRTEGEAGLADRSWRPRHSPRRLPAAREQLIVACRIRCRVGPHRIGWMLGEAPSTVHAVLRRQQLPRLWELDRPTGQVVRYQRQRPGELLHIDVKKQGRIPDGGGHRMLGRAGGHRDRRHGVGFDFLHVAVDDCSRVAYVEVHPNERSHTAAGFTVRALAWFAGLGVNVDQVMTDNGPCSRAAAFGQVLAAAGVRHRRTRPYRPCTNGKAERFNQTLAREWAYAAAYTSNQDRQATLPGWLHAYNHHRPHSALNGRSPMNTLNNLPGNHT